MKTHGFILFSLFMLVTGAWGGGPQDAEARREHIRQAEAAVREALSGNTAEELSRVDRLMEPLAFRPDDPPEIRGPLAELKLELWLLAIARVDASIDPNFNPNSPDNQVTMNVPYPPGITRSDGSPDEKVWAEYRAAVEANEVRAARARNQGGLKSMRFRYIKFTQFFIEGFFSRTPEDRALVEKKLNELVPNKLLAAELRQKLLPPLERN